MATIQTKARWSDDTGFKPMVCTRPGSPRAKRYDLRAKLVHTSTNGRRVELFITAGLMEKIGWCLGGRVGVDWKIGPDAFVLKLSAAHKGSRLSAASKKTTTCRIVISGDVILSSACAPIRSVDWAVTQNKSLQVILPAEWADIRASAAEIAA